MSRAVFIALTCLKEVIFSGGFIIVDIMAVDIQIILVGVLQTSVQGFVPVIAEMLIHFRFSIKKREG